MIGVLDTYNFEMGLSAGFLIRGHCSSGVATILLWLVDDNINTNKIY